MIPDQHRGTSHRNASGMTRWGFILIGHFKFYARYPPHFRHPKA